MYKLFYGFFRDWYYIQKDDTTYHNRYVIYNDRSITQVEKILFLKGIKVDKVLGTEIDKETYDLLRKYV